jgi:predicted MPP superfamily phosphohydrolase
VIAGSSFLPLDSFAGKKKKSIRFAHLTDIHVKRGDIPETGMAKAFQHAQSISPKVEFIINGGDSIMDALQADKQKTQEQFKLFKTILQKENNLPIYYAIGNHDIWGWFVKDNDLIKQDNLYGKQWVVEEFGMPGRHYSFNKGVWKFIILDSTQLNPAGGYIGKLDDDQFQWLEQ